ncbi:hypothetical protein HZS_2006 [Henneguya salminicola]|nr:hypothetical protein HZS_2006 [Henneguya salminicola]
MEHQINILDEIMNELKISPTINSKKFSDTKELDHSMVVGQIMSLSSVPDLVSVSKETTTHWTLTTEGEDIVKNGSYEYRLYSSIPETGIFIKEAKEKFFKGDIALNKALAYKWVRLVKEKESKLYKNNEKVNDITRDELIEIRNGFPEKIDSKRINELKKRQLITISTFTAYNVAPGSSFHMGIPKQETDLTVEMISTGAWETANFKKYNFIAYGVPPKGGCFHPLMKPQQHPSREAHDTFFLQGINNKITLDPSTSDLRDAPCDYIERVKEAHETGIKGSLGYDWKIEEAQKLILRTHTTAVSTRMLYLIGQQKEFHPVKYFSIDRVFRNEASDSTHLSEFHQIEGVVADRNLSLAHLIGVLYDFFNQLGMHKLKFKPAYNPYTEPSMEIFSYHEGLKKWVEVGNSGIFRREMLDPMGIPENVNVIAWGLSLERPTMIKYNINNIRSLVGHKIDLESLQKSPACLIKGSFS